MQASSRVARVAPALVRMFASRGVTMETLNPLVKAADYAVRGELVIKAGQYQKVLDDPKLKGTLPFSEITSCNIGNPHSLGQKPITFFRQVASLITYPWLLEQPKIRKMFPSDAVARAQRYLKNIPGGSGAYTHSQGLDVVRQDIAKFIEERDGFPCNKEDLFVTDGASPAVKAILQISIRGPSDGILIPIPQYPLYSASIALCNGSQVGYFLDEDNGWAISVPELERSVAEARAKGISVRAICIINPGNPTGQCLPEKVIRDIIEFAHRESLVLLADEVYQENIYNSALPFVSFKKALMSMGSKYSDSVQLASFHSISKGFVGECGRRGGYMELVNFPEDVKGEVYKLASVNLCSNVEGQIFAGLMCQPPKPGDESYATYIKERDDILQSLKARAKLTVEALNAMQGVKCNSVDGAMYAFPSITLPPKAVAAAQAAGKVPDTFYCLQCLAETGLVVVPGSGFGQRKNTWHFRTTILPHISKIAAVYEKMKVFHAKFMEKYS